MLTSLSEQNLYRIIGGAFTILFIGLILFTYKQKTKLDHLGSHQYLLHAYFKDATGIHTGSPVLLAGMPIGHVMTLALNDHHMVAVKLAINMDYNIPVDSSIRILSNDFMGKKYLSVAPGASSDNMQAGQSFEYTQSSIEIMSLLEKALNLMERQKKKNHHHSGKQSSLSIL